MPRSPNRANAITAPSRDFSLELLFNVLLSSVIEVLSATAARKDNGPTASANVTSTQATRRFPGRRLICHRLGTELAIESIFYAVSRSKYRCATYAGVVTVTADYWLHMAQFTDTQFRIVVGVASVGLIAALTTWRFCGDVQIAPKPPAPVLRGQTAGELLTASTETQTVWAGYLETDAHVAGVAAPSVAAMSAALQWREGHTDHDLALGDPAIELAGLKVQFVLDASNDNAVVTLTNDKPDAVAYQLTTKTNISKYVCDSTKHSPHNTLMVAGNSTEKVSVCSVRPDMTASITLQTVQLSPLATYYIQMLPPTLIGVDDKLAKVHQNGRSTTSPCGANPSSGVKGGLSNGKISWRDLIDFYARHRCETYRFPLSYRAFTKDAERPLPAVEPS